MMGLNRTSIVSKDRLKKAISYLIPCENFHELKIPLKVISTDLNSGNDIITTSGDLVEAIVQSSSIPGFVEPTKNKDIKPTSYIFVYYYPFDINIINTY